MIDGLQMVNAQKLFFGTQLIQDKGFKDNPALYIQEFCTGHEDKLEKIAKSLQEKYGEDEKELASLAVQIKYTQAYLRLAACYGEQLGNMTEVVEFQQIAMQYMGIVRGQLELLGCL